jgi:hypothetical protein
MAQLQRVLDRLRQDAGAEAVLVLDHTGSIVTGVAAEGARPEFLLEASLGQLGQADALARAVRQEEFFVLFHEPFPEPRGLHLRRVGRGSLLVLIFNSATSPLAEVRKAAREAADELDDCLG